MFRLTKISANELSSLAEVSLYLLISTITFEVVTLGLYTTIPAILLFLEALIEVCGVSVFGTCCDSAWIYSMDTKRRPF